MSFALDSGDALIVWEDDGKVSGFPSDAVSDAEDALMAPGVQRATPTGPFFAEGTPEASFLVLRRMWPQAEVSGDPPVFEEQPDELDAPEPVQEAVFDPAKHPRGRGGEWIDTWRRKMLAKLPPHLLSREEFNSMHPSYDWGRSSEVAERFDALPDDAEVWLYHATDEATAHRLTHEGIDPKLKPLSLGRQRYEAGEYAEFQPGAGLARGLTVGFDPRGVEGYGRYIVAVRVRKGDVKAPPEQHGSTPGQALSVSDAFVDAPISYLNVRLLGDAARGVPVGEQRVPGHPHDEFQKSARQTTLHFGAEVSREMRDRVRKEVAEAMEAARKAGFPQGSVTPWQGDEKWPHELGTMLSVKNDPAMMSAGLGGRHAPMLNIAHWEAMNKPGMGSPEENHKDNEAGRTPIFQHENLGDIALHEFGHQLMGSMDDEWRKRWADYFNEHAGRTFDDPSIYGQEAPSEAFAETFVALVRGRKAGQGYQKLLREWWDQQGRLTEQHAVREAYEEPLHPRNALGRWARKPGLIHPFKHVAEGAKGSYEVERTGKVWEARKNGQRLGLTRALARAKDMVAEHDSGDYGRDRRALLEDAYRGGGHIHEVWGGDPVVMPEDEYQAARARLTELHDSIGSGTPLDRDLRAMIEGTLWRVSGGRAARQR